MAYRKLCAVTFAVLGLAAVGCGGGTSTGTTGASSNDGQPPNNATDQTPLSGTTDRAPKNSDSPPSSVDSPPPSAETPAGTGNALGALCRRFCDALTKVASDCSDSDIKVDLPDCGGADACQVPPGTIPCANEIADLFNCAIDSIQLVCGGASADPNQAAICQDSVTAFTSCAEAHGLQDNGGNMMMTPGGGMPRGCYPAGGCEMCDGALQTCVCKAGTDTSKLAACQ